MNNKGRGNKYTGWIIASFFMFMCIISCKKDDPTIAIISVVDRNNEPVANAQVTLWQDTAVNAVNGVTSDIRELKFSDAGGKAQFEFKLEAFLNVEVIKGVDTGRSFVRLKEHETVTQVVNL